MMLRRVFANLTIIVLMFSSLLTLTIYGLPSLLKSQLIAIIQQQTGGTATLGSLKLGVAPLSIHLQKFSLQDHNHQPFAQFDNVLLQINTWQSLKHSALVIDTLSLTEPTVRIIKQKNGQLNIDSLLNTKTDKPPNDAPFPIRINQLSLSDGSVAWEDAAYKETLQNIKFTLTNFSNTTATKAQLNLQLQLKSGGELHWQSETSLNPLHSTGHITLDAIKLQQLAALGIPDLKASVAVDTDYQLHYTDKKISVTSHKTALKVHDFHYTLEKDNLITFADLTHETDIALEYAANAWLINTKHSKTHLQTGELSTSGLTVSLPTVTHEMDVNARYAHNEWQFSSTHNTLNSQNVQLSQPNTTVKILALNLSTALDVHNGQFSVKHATLNSQHLQLLEKTEQQPLLDIASLALQGGDIDIHNQALTIDSIVAIGANARSWLTSQGQLNYQSLFPASTTNTPTSPTPPWRIHINAVTLSDCGLNFEDRTANKPVTVTLKPIAIKLTDISNQTGATLPFQITTGINKTGTIQLNGDAVIEPFKLQLAVHTDAVDLVPFQRYLDTIARLDIADGKLAIEGKLALNSLENKALDIKFSGDTSISDFITRDQKRHKNLLTWQNLTLKNLAVDVIKNRYTADALIINKPYARVIIRKDKTLNFSDIFIHDDKPTAKQTLAPAPFFKLRKAQIIDGSSDFADNSLILPFATEIKSLDGGATDISSEQKAKIIVSLKGNAYDLSPVDIDGHISPYLGNYDLTLNFKGMPMPLISPYMAEFAGYKVEKGKMTLNLKYKVVDGELTASNNVLIDQFELGEKVDNPRAVSLPLELAVALLKDADGNIKINVPITGSLNDPKFSITAVLIDALKNTLSKVITSPFRALASLTDDDEDLSLIHFKAGKAVLEKAEQEKLTVLAHSLKQRPSLILDIKGAAFQTQDWPVLRETALYEQLKQLRADELNKHSDTKVLAEYVELSYDDYKRLLAQRFMEKFPQLAKKPIMGALELIDSEEEDFYETAKQQLAVTLKSQPQRLKNLATQRARAIASYLVQQGGVPNEQIFILDTVVDPERNNNDITSILSLKAK